MEKTSETDPILVNFVPLPDEIKGKLGMTFAPGKIQPYSATGVCWKRDVDKDLVTLQSVHFCNILVSLMSLNEFSTYKNESVLTKTAGYGIESVLFPIPDGHVPSEDKTEPFCILIKRIVDGLRNGKVVVVHCLGGLGRTGLVTACVLIAVNDNMTGDEAIQVVRTKRKGTVQSYGQVRFVHDFRSMWNKHIVQVKTEEL